MIDAAIAIAGLAVVVAAAILAARWLGRDDDDEKWRIDNGHG